jgi:septal ring factor EnvC (AmiA/AmiB activator)
MADLFEHEKNMEHPMYKKGFQYVFDHYGVPRLPSEELIDLRKKYSKLSDEYKEYQETALSSVKETKKELEAMDKDLLDIVTKMSRRDSTIRKLRYENNKKKKHIKLLESKLESLQSKWYLKPFINIT